MKANAILRSSKTVKSEPSTLQDYVGAAALAYTLDEQNAKMHASRVCVMQL